MKVNTSAWTQPTQQVHLNFQSQELEEANRGCRRNPSCFAQDPHQEMLLVAQAVPVWHGDAMISSHSSVQAPRTAKMEPLALGLLVASILQLEDFAVFLLAMPLPMLPPSLPVTMPLLYLHFQLGSQVAESLCQI